MAKRRTQVATPLEIREFFAHSEFLDYVVLRPLSHIRGNWESTWDRGSGRYLPEEDSFADALNGVIDDLAAATIPSAYHDHEDRLAEYVRDGHLRWPIRKIGKRWVGMDYRVILEQGGFRDLDQRDLVAAAAGRVSAAVQLGQLQFDDMEESHREMLGVVLSIILYHRADYNP